jgi:hypothetical protein
MAEDFQEVKKNLKTIFTILAAAGCHERLSEHSPAASFCSNKYLLQDVASLLHNQFPIGYVGFHINRQTMTLQFSGEFHIYHLQSDAFDPFKIPSLDGVAMSVAKVDYASDTCGRTIKLYALCRKMHDIGMMSLDLYPKLGTKWQKESLPYTEYEQTWLTLIGVDDKVYSFTASPTDKYWVYCVRTKKWEVLPNSPMTSHFPSAMGVDKKIYVRYPFTGDTCVLDTECGTWSTDTVLKGYLPVDWGLGCAVADRYIICFVRVANYLDDTMDLYENAFIIYDTVKRRAYQCPREIPREVSLISMFYANDWLYCFGSERIGNKFTFVGYKTQLGRGNCERIFQNAGIDASGVTETFFW